MPDKSGVNVLDPPSGETGDDNPPGEGDTPPGDRPEINKASEKLRKENEALKAQMQEMKEGFEERIKQLENKPALTQTQADELHQLRVKVDAIKSNPEAKAWIELQREIAREEAQKVRDEESRGTDEAIDSAMDWLDSKAESLKLEPKSLQTDILDILDGGKWASLSPLRRVKTAYAYWQKLQEKYGKKAPEVPEHAETPGRKVKSLSGSEAVKSAISTGSTKELLAAIAAKQVQESSEK